MPSNVRYRADFLCLETHAADGHPQAHLVARLNVVSYKAGANSALRLIRKRGGVKRRQADRAEKSLVEEKNLEEKSLIPLPPTRFA